jgi:glycosyltransferase involved in cell wall biosynthesis
MSTDANEPRALPKQDRLRASVILCTYRRPVLLQRAIASLLHQSLPHDEFEIIVVDNHSGDETPDVVAALARESAARIVLIEERRQGLCHARNTGIERAAGEVVALMDDDAEASPGWLAALLAVLDREPEVCAVGGRISGIWEAPRPEWLPADMDPWLSLLDRGDVERDLDVNEFHYGCNLALRAAVFARFGAFRPELGRRGDVQLDSEELELQRRMHRAGARIRYVPWAEVGHRVPRERLVPGYFTRRAIGAGRSEALRRTLEDGRIPLRGAARRLLTLPLKIPALWGSVARGRLRRRVLLAREWGFAVETLRMLVCGAPSRTDPVRSLQGGSRG